MKRTVFSTILVFLCLICNAEGLFTFGTKTRPDGARLEVDDRGFLMNGKHIIPVMGEIHFSRIQPQHWRREIQKMKAGGITIAATYIFWNHHEAEEGIWNWSGKRNLRAFLQTCKEEQMNVVLRLGPFCHGEVYLGGMPLWLAEKAYGADSLNYQLRTLAPGFMDAVRHLYGQIGLQARGMMWKDGGPVVGVQIENECSGPWAYLMELRNIALESGIDVPFMTRTGWPTLTDQEEYGMMLPLFGDYADGFWERSMEDMPGEYPEAFIFKDKRMSGVIATDQFSADQLSTNNGSENQYPYLTCELGGGMMPSYHRRLNMSGNEAMPLAICKLGSGSNLPGYYMYHGGTNDFNPDHTMAECQASLTINYNDLPYMTYDFQAPLGEVGQPNPNSYHQTRWLHQFLADWGGELALMPVDSLSPHYARRGCFEFRNDYVRILNEKGIASVTPLNLQLEQGITISSSALQPFARLNDGYLFIAVPGKKPTAIINGRKYQLPIDNTRVICGRSFTVLSRQKALTAYVFDGKLYYAQHGGILYQTATGITEECIQYAPQDVTWQQTSQAGPARNINMGSMDVAEQPSDADFDLAARYTIDIPASQSQIQEYLEISYCGDCARLYADGVLVQDNFWNGKPMLVDMQQLIGKKVELRILPLRKDAPIYLQKEQKELLQQSPSTLLSLNRIRHCLVVMHNA